MKSVTKTVLPVWLSVALALPMPSFAANEPRESTGSADDVPIVFQSGEINGRQGTIFLMPVPRAEEAELIGGLAKSPDRTVLLVSGPEDNALKAAARTGVLQRFKTFLVGRDDQAPVLVASDLPLTRKEKLLEAFKSINDSLKSDTAIGLYFGFAYAGIQGGFTAYASSSVGAGLAVFTMYALWNSFILTKPEIWGKALEAGGNGAVGLAQRAASLTGVELSEREKRLYEVAGKFIVSWSVGAMHAGFVKYWSGDFLGQQGVLGFVEGLSDSLMAGVENNYNIWDAVVLKSNADGGFFNEKRTKRYFRWQMVAGAILESMAFRGVPFIGVFLTSVTAAGAIYLALHPEDQVTLNRRAMKFSVAARASITSINRPKRPDARNLRYYLNTCASLLKPYQADKIHKRQPYEDIQ